MIIPALDEEVSIGAVIEAVPRQSVAEIIVVDGGSRDATADVARALGARVVSEPRRGYGRACARGASEAIGDVVVFIDADGAFDPREIGALVAPVTNDGADLVLGSRFHAGAPAVIRRGAMPFQQRVGNRLAAFLIHALYGLPLSDLSPFRAVRRRSLLMLPLDDLTYGWPTEMIVKAARAGWHIVEVPVSVKPRTGGRSKVSGTLHGASLAAAHIFDVILGSRLPWRRQAAAPTSSSAAARAESVVVIMARQPVPGRSKTRLCPPLTPVEAAALYEGLLGDTIDLVSGLRGIEMTVAVTPAAATGVVADLAPPGTRMLAVEGADIGECLASVTQRMLSQGFARVLALNSDGPTLPAACIELAVELLRENDVVLGPAEDGGYYLIGLREPQPELFRGISWSTEQVAAQTLERARTHGLTVARLPAWYDVDTPADLERLRADLATLPPGIAPRTHRLLARQ